ncbi:MAG: 50S ribosomal protein L22 [Betaproteobacteria bacterium AqS2]|uniref:Large ribosomal subunit protein uL22 n=1 Tax=Candidatus Amphirhobacter heronislandensis TaxID=1732024 RepID=A0A930Y1P8_9GAMM|nr:50S ribosomal protein L22 [Betaproteobacteria bacterium AqS2]
MAATAYQTYVARKRNSRGSPRKMQLAAALIRGKAVQEASDILDYSITKSSRILNKLLGAAIANAEQSNADVDSLHIAEVRVNKGMVLKRFKASGRGRVRANCHRYTHIDLLLEDRSAPLAAEVKEKKPAAAEDKPAAEDKE